MFYVIYLVLLLYSIPLIAVLLAAIVSGFFGADSRFIYIAATLSITFLKQLWDTFGNLAVPLVTAFSIPIRGADQEIPRPTLILISVLAALFLLSIAIFGLISSSENQIRNFGGEIYATFRDITLAYIKGFLTYFAMTLGISFKR